MPGQAELPRERAAAGSERLSLGLEERLHSIVGAALLDLEHGSLTQEPGHREPIASSTRLGQATIEHHGGLGRSPQ
jgi:hypothetical protein